MIVQYAFANKGASFSRPRRNEFRGQIRKSANVSIILKETGAGLPKGKAAKKAEAKAEKPKEQDAPKTDVSKDSNEKEQKPQKSEKTKKEGMETEQKEKPKTENEDLK